MPIKPKDSRLVGFNRVKPRLQRLPKRTPIPEGLTLAQNPDGARLAYNPPASSPNPLITPNIFLPAHLRQHSQTPIEERLPPLLQTKKTEHARLNAEEIEEVRALRDSGMSAHAIAAKYKTSSLFVSLVAPLSRTAREQMKIAEAERQSAWSERKQIYAQIRQNRKAAWGT